MTTKKDKENVVDEKKYELFLAITEKNKRKKLNLIWEYKRKELLENKLFYTENDKTLIKQLLYNPIDEKDRGEYWFIITGAKLEYTNNRGYYQKLKSLIEKHQNFPFVKTITLDMHRTFPNNPFFKDEKNLTKLSNVLKAFALRNCSSIQYCQGFNYIAAQLLLVLEDEEKVFWTFTKIIEDYLPFDFYLKFTGVRVDMTIVHSILVKKLDYIEKNEELNLCINNLVSRCFISLYSEIVGVEILKNIWDAFFVYGDVILFRTFNFIAFLLCDEKFKKYNIEAVHEELTNKLHQITSNDLLNYFLLIEKKINDSFVKGKRKEKKSKIIEQNTQFDESYGDGNVECDLKSPFCYFNNINNIENFSHFKIFKLGKKTKKNDNYFCELFQKKNINEIKNENEKISNNENFDDFDDFDDVLVERMEHCCPQSKETKK